MYLPIFEKKDFTLCDVAVPTGYPQSQTHVGVACHNGKYYLTCSPYPLMKYSRFKAHWLSLLQKITSGRWGRIPDAEKYENPMLYVGVGEKDISPTKFNPVTPFPLMDTPTPVYGMPAYNSDPDIFIENDDVYILNRAYYRHPSVNGANEKEVLISLIRGRIGDNGYQMIDILELKKSSDSLISPCLIKYKGKYLFTSLETNSAIDGHTFDGLFMQKSDSVLGLMNENDKKKIVVKSDNMLPWHMSLFTYHERLFAIVTCVEKDDNSHLWQMLGEFDEDLSVIRIFQMPLTDYNSYRGSAYVDKDGIFHLYSTTLREKIQGGKSIDGREVILASKSFLDILNRVKK